MFRFIEECAADGCYEKNLGFGKQMCAKHQKMYDEGVSFKGFFGKTVLKKCFQQPDCDHDYIEDETFHGYGGVLRCTKCGEYK